jgi:Metallo-beta-lactamase superfamily
VKRTRKGNAASGTTVTVRMYRQGLGDCFLLTFPGPDKPVYMLIDCGVWDNDAATVAQMSRVIADIDKTTGGQLDVLIATHEHWDHVSGFLQGADVFKHFTIKEVWLAWTENPVDPVGKQLKKEYAAKRQQLRLAVNHLGSLAPQRAARIDELLAASGSVRADPAAAMAWVRNLADKGTTVRFWSPGDVAAVPRSSDVHAYVLGPPKAEDELRRNLPTGAQRKAGEVYLRSGNDSVDRAFFAAIARQGMRSGHVPDAEIQEQTLPFDPSQQVTPKAAQGDRFFQHHYGFSKHDANAWRRIDADWLDVAAELALWLDSSTNNTSLVLAIEVGAGGGTLIFAADAQIGNWMSWFDVTFPNAPDGTKVTATSLLARAVLYKVGHHGSHNATLRKRGIDAMTRDDLVAMIPVNRASVEKKHWKMPFAPMYRALLERTRGRVLRADDGVVTDKATNDAAWSQFLSRVKTTPLYVEYQIPQSSSPGPRPRARAARRRST